jgi:hypothetical protein
VIHRNVALIACDTAMTLRETMQRITDLDVDAVAVGERHLVLPHADLERVLGRLKELGQYPRLVGAVEPRGEEQA